MPEETLEAAVSATPPAKSKDESCPRADEVYRGGDGLWEGKHNRHGVLRQTG